MATTPAATEKLLSIPVLAARENLLYSEAYSRVLRGDFGKPIRVGLRWFVAP